MICTRCNKGEALAPHSCPYAEELDGIHDDEFCDCCEDCTDYCAECI